MYGTQVCVLKQANKISLGSLLEGKDGGSFVAFVIAEILRDLTDKTVEGRLADEQFGRFLVAADLTKGDGAWAVAVGLLHPTGGGGGLAGRLGGELFAADAFASRGFPCGLLRPGHDDDCCAAMDDSLDESEGTPALRQVVVAAAPVWTSLPFCSRLSSLSLALPARCQSLSPANRGANFRKRCICPLSRLLGKMGFS